jgi:hypothetical protein
MVTIKTLTQRLERLLEDKAGRDQVKRMTGERSIEWIARWRTCCSSLASANRWRNRWR